MMEIITPAVDDFFATLVSGREPSSAQTASALNEVAHIVIGFFANVERIANAIERISPSPAAPIGD